MFWGTLILVILSAIGKVDWIWTIIVAIAYGINVSIFIRAIVNQIRYLSDEEDDEKMSDTERLADALYGDGINVDPFSKIESENHTYEEYVSEYEYNSHQKWTPKIPLSGGFFHDYSFVFLFSMISFATFGGTSS